MFCLFRKHQRINIFYNLEPIKYQWSKRGGFFFPEKFENHGYKMILVWFDKQFLSLIGYQISF